MFSWIKLYIFIACVSGICSLIGKKNFFDLCFFVKIVTMFKLLVILLVIKLYARNGIFKNGDWLNPNINLLKPRNGIVFFVKISIQWNFKDFVSFSLIRSWRKTFPDVSAQKDWSKSCSSQNVPEFALNGWPLFQTIVKKIPRLWFGRSIIYFIFVDSEFCLINGLCSRKKSFGLHFDFLKTFLLCYLLTDLWWPDYMA